MRRKCPTLFLLTAGLLLLFASLAAAQFKLKTWQTQDMRLVYYDEEHAYVKPYLARCFENSMTFHRKLFHYTPTEPVTVLLQDFDDYGFAGASALPFNYLTIGIEPFEQVYETSPTNERLNWVMSHELLHIVASDQSSPGDRFFRTVFGGKVLATDEEPLSMLYSYLTAPRRYAPRWFHEGMAVFMETWMAGGYGRALGGYDEMVFRTMVHDDAYFYELVGLESEGTTTDFQIGQNAYLYGTRFVSYVAYKYSPQKLMEWLNRTKGSKGGYAAQYKHVFGESLDQGWKEWIAWEHAWQTANLDSIAQYPLTPYRVISKHALGSVSRGYYDRARRKFYTAALYPGDFAHVAAIDIDTWNVEKIAEVSTPALYYVCSLAFDDSTGTLYFTTDNSRQYRDLNAVNVDERKAKRVLDNFRTGDIVFSGVDKSIWGVQHHNGVSSLVRIPPPYEYWNYVMTLPFGKDIFDIDLSPDGKYLTASMMEISGRQRLIRMSTDQLLIGNTTYEVLYEFANNSPENFVYSPDGRYLYGTSYYTGVSNVFRYDFETRKMEALTNGDTGFFRPVPVSDDSLIAFRYTAKGFVPVMLPIKPIEDVSPVRFLGEEIVHTHPVVKDWMLGSPADVNIDSLTTVTGDYNGFRNIKLNSFYPVVEGYKNRTAVGLRFNFQEPVGLHDLALTAAVTPTNGLPDDEKAHVVGYYRRWPWEFHANYNGADFYDLFGPTKTSRKGYSASIQYEGLPINDRPKHLDYKVRLAGYGGLQRLPDYQNVAASFDNYLTVSASLNFHSFGKTIGGIESERGVEWRLRSLGNYVNDDFFPRVWADFNYGVLLPWDHSSIWVRSSAGQSFGDRYEPFANFFFGGFGNNWVDHGSVDRYRDYYSYPGIELNELAGTNFGKFMMEWALPPVRFRRFGVPTVYANWAHLSFFTSAVSTNVDNRPIRRTLLNLGAQVNFKIVAFTAFPYTLSIGYAGAVEKNERPSYEFMVSLKIL